jgi:hypothetical protein
MVTSENALLYSYAMWLIGRYDFGLDLKSLRPVLSRWFFMAHTTGRYTSSPESQLESDLNRISFLSPGIWQDVSGTTTLSVSIQSNVVVARVDYTVSPAFVQGGGEVVQQVIGSATAAPFSLDWDTSQSPDGPSVLKATVYDANGNSATAQVHVSIVNYPCGGPPPPEGIDLSSIICPDGWAL